MSTRNKYTVRRGDASLLVLRFAKVNRWRFNLPYLRYMNPSVFTNTANVNRMLESMVKYGLIVPVPEQGWEVTASGVRTMVSLASEKSAPAVLSRQVAHV
jgi:hypothetical protein